MIEFRTGSFDPSTKRQMMSVGQSLNCCLGITWTPLSFSRPFVFVLARGGEGAGQTDGLEGKKEGKESVDSGMDGKATGDDKHWIHSSQLGLTPLSSRGKFGPRATVHYLVIEIQRS